MASRSSRLQWTAIAFTLSQGTSTLMSAICSSVELCAATRFSIKVWSTTVLSDNLNVMEVREQCHDFVKAIIDGHSGGELEFGRPFTIGEICVSTAKCFKRGSSGKAAGKAAES